MRASYTPEIDLDNPIVKLTGNKLHHLKNVVRVKRNEEILLLNGQGKGRKYQVKSIDKKEISLVSASSTIVKEEPRHLDLCIGKVKKDALDLILKQCCEMGIQTIFICETKYAQKYPLKGERIEKLLISGMEQSNNFWLPEVREVSLDEIKSLDYDSIVLATPKDSEPIKSIGDKTLLLVGPEGGFSKDETSSFLEIENIQQMNLKMNILRAPTAVTCAAGYLHRLLV